MRLFFAVSIPDTALAVLCSVQHELSIMPRVRLVPRQNMHITLSFLGDVQRGEVPELIKVAQQVTVEPCAVSISGPLHGFPGNTRWTVAVVSVSDRKLMLTQLNQRLALGAKAEKRYVPHITLARSQVEQTHMPQAVVQPVSFDVTEFHLYESILGPQGPRYRPLQSFRL